MFDPDCVTCCLAGSQACAVHAESAPVLMSAENPGGHKLEDLLVQLQIEIAAKTEKIAGDTSDLSLTIQRNNREIYSLLRTAEALQRASYSLMAKKAPDSGPGGSPRIGNREG